MKYQLKKTFGDFTIQVAGEEHEKYAEEICREIEESAKIRGTGIAKRKPEYIKQKMREQKAIIAIHRDGSFAGFCYIETWSHGKYIANSGLIIPPQFRGQHLGKAVKEVAFELSRKKFPEARLFGITTSYAVMKINSDLGYKPVPYSELTTDEEFWDGCKTCVNYDILQRNNRKNCLCTALLYDADKQNKSRKTNRDDAVVLAYSGGLDTSYCAAYLSHEMQLKVHAVCVNTGGFSEDELKEMKAKALALGVEKFVVLNREQEFYEKCIKYLIYGNVLKYNTYPLSVSSERVFQAMAIAEYAKEIGAAYVAHGSTGAGNDQVRFDVVFNIMIPEIEILTPIRDLNISRQDEVTYLKQLGIDLEWNQAKYSINKGIWGTSVGGEETLTSHQGLPENAFPGKVTKHNSETVQLDFEKGQLVRINNQLFSHPVDAIRYLDTLVTAYGIGRDIHVGDTIIGMKGRVGFEAPAPIVIIKAHHTLEKHVLGRWQLYWKDQLANWYGMLLHEAQFLDPVMRDIEIFLEHTQKLVTGSVFVHVAPYHSQVIGVNSPYDMMSGEFGKYGEQAGAWTGNDVRSFSKILANQIRMYQKVLEKNGI
ncbi:MAG: hypothetical protein Kow00108_05760 [Calditrichia bacterium]